MVRSPNDFRSSTRTNFYGVPGQIARHRILQHTHYPSLATRAYSRIDHNISACLLIDVELPRQVPPCAFPGICCRFCRELVRSRVLPGALVARRVGTSRARRHAEGDGAVHAGGMVPPSACHLGARSLLPWLVCSLARPGASTAGVCFLSPVMRVPFCMALAELQYHLMISNAGT